MRGVSAGTIAGLCACLALAACGGGGGGGDSGAPTAKASCEALATIVVAPGQIGLPTSGASVRGVAFVPASASDVEHCRVDAAIAPVDAAAPPILFALELPTAWNGKLMQLGGGGFDGSVDAAMATFSLLSPRSPTARGYAVVASDGGHESASGDASFALNDEALRNFAGDQVKKTHDAALALLEAREGAPPSRTYFVGASNGGREAFAAFQRWPGDYDGVVALMPAFDLTAVLLKLQLIDRAMRGNGTAGWLNPVAAATLSAAVTGRCDALDGLADGIVSDPGTCAYTPAQLAAPGRCPGGADQGGSCLSDVQIGTYDVMSTSQPLPYALANGIVALPPFSPFADWPPMLGSLGDFTSPPAIAAVGPPFWHADQFVRYMVLRDADADSLAFDPLDPGAALPRLQALSALLDPTSTAIDAYLAKGGKLIVLHGQSDSFVATQPTVDYYQGLVARFGQARVDAAVRLYLVPGFGHGTGPFNPEGSLPLFDALESWVERGVAPAGLTSQTISPTASVGARPLCPYPTIPTYSGAGNPADAASFTCI